MYACPTTVRPKYGFPYTTPYLTISKPISSHSIPTLPRLHPTWTPSFFQMLYQTQTPQNAQTLHLNTPGKLFDMIKGATTQKANPQILKLLQEISAACVACAPHTASSFRFRTTILPDETIFNRKLTIDLIYLNKKPVLHILDAAKKFQNANFIRSESREDIWKAFLKFWVAVYT